MTKLPIHRLILLVLAVPAVLARPKIDSLTLLNGNEVTCEIRSLSRGMLTAKTDSLSQVSIRWEDVTRIRSAHVFEILLTDRSVHFGALDSDASGLLLPGMAPIPLHDIVALTPIESRVAKRFDGSVDMGYSFMQSESTTQLNFAGEVGYTTRRRALDLGVSSNLVIRNQTDSTRRVQADLTFNETLSRGYFALGVGQFSMNDELNLLQRYLGGGALGRYLVRTNRSMFSAYGGGAISLERYAGAERHNNGEILLAMNTQLFRLYSPKLDITGDFRFWQNVTTSGRFRIDANAKAKIEVYKDLFVSFSFFDNYDRKNPTTALPINDYGVVLSLGYTFNR